MVQFQGLTHAVLGFVSAYGLLAVFVYMALETGLLLHFVPSELVIPFAAALLVHDPATFILFVVVTTAGATTGSLLAYYLFGRNGERVLDRYGNLVGVSHDDFERGQRWYRRWGEGSVFWGRLLPVVRGLVSIPAGMAEMDPRRFALYSALGALVYDTGLTYLVYAGERAGTPVARALAGLRAVFRVDLVYARTHPGVVVVLFALLAGVSLLLWVRREWIRAHPRRAIEVGTRWVRRVALVVAALLCSAALALPETTYQALVPLWNDPAFLVQQGATRQQALVLVGLAVAGVGVGISWVATWFATRRWATEGTARQ